MRRARASIGMGLEPGAFAEWRDWPAEKTPRSFHGRYAKVKIEAAVMARFIQYEGTLFFDTETGLWFLHIKDKAGNVTVVSLDKCFSFSMRKLTPREREDTKPVEDLAALLAGADGMIADAFTGRPVPRPPLPSDYVPQQDSAPRAGHWPTSVPGDVGDAPLPRRVYGIGGPAPEPNPDLGRFAGRVENPDMVLPGTTWSRWHRNVPTHDYPMAQVRLSTGQCYTGSIVVDQAARTVRILLGGRGVANSVVTIMCEDFDDGGRWRLQTGGLVRRDGPPPVVEASQEPEPDSNGWLYGPIPPRMAAGVEIEAVFNTASGYATNGVYRGIVTLHDNRWWLMISRGGNPSLEMRSLQFVAQWRYTNAAPN